MNVFSEDRGLQQKLLRLRQTKIEDDDNSQELDEVFRLNTATELVAPDESQTSLMCTLIELGQDSIDKLNERNGVLETLSMYIIGLNGFYD